MYRSKYHHRIFRDIMASCSVASAVEQTRTSTTSRRCHRSIQCLLLSRRQRPCCRRWLSTIPEHRITTTVANVFDDNLQPPEGGIPDNVATLIHEYTQKQQTPASLEWLLKTGRGEQLTGDCQHDEAFWGKMGHRLATERILMQMATFVRQELPIRLAHRILDLDQVPFMRDMPSVQAVKQIYIQSFLELIQQPPLITDAVMEANFSSKLEALYQKHSNVLLQMARGAYELRQAIRDGTLSSTSSTTTITRSSFSPHNNKNHKPKNVMLQDMIFNRHSDCHVFLDKFYMSRIGIRVLAGQYLALRNPPSSISSSSSSLHRGYIGMICQNTSPKEWVERAAQDATMMCTRKYGEAPEVVLLGRLDLTFPYIPTHLHYILLELLKNAMRATVEQHQLEHDATSFLPPVTVIIADGTDNEDVVIKIMDEGGGIPRSQVDNIWSYLFTTADASIQDTFIKHHQDHSQQSPIAGLGYGLPISRSYARYFGGDLDIMSMEGYGTDAYVHLARLGDSPEPLPI